MVVAFFATTTQYGAMESKFQEHKVAFYNLDIIISVGYRFHSYRGVQFRIWATKMLKEYIVKGFAVNDDLLKRAGGGMMTPSVFSERTSLPILARFMQSWQGRKQMRNTTSSRSAPRMDSPR